MDKDYTRPKRRKLVLEEFFLEAAIVGRVRRPRIYSVHGMPFIQGVDGRIVERQMMRNQEYQIPAIHIDTERPPVDWFLAPGAKKGEDELEPFPTITRPQVRT